MSVPVALVLVQNCAQTMMALIYALVPTVPEL